MSDPEVSLDRFLKFVEGEKDTLARQIRQFQMKHREGFSDLGTGEHTTEHSHAHMDVYRSYIALLESFSERFKRDQGMSDDDVIGMIELLQAKQPDLWTPFEALLDKSDYTVFSKCLAAGTCLCCGESFIGDEEDADAES